MVRGLSGGGMLWNIPPLLRRWATPPPPPPPPPGEKLGGELNSPVVTGLIKGLTAAWSPN
eukprot:6551952-Pyramimonas_sp.AAC.2